MPVVFRRLAKWLFWDARAFWAAVPGSLAALIVAMLLPGPPERRVRIAGFLVTLLGVALVVKEIAETARLFKRPSLWSRTRGWLARLPGILGRSPQVHAASVSMMGGLKASGQAVVRHNPANPDSWRSWVDALWKNMALVEQRITEEAAQRERQISSLQSSLEHETQKREDAVRAINQRVEDISAGGLDWALVGAIWVVVGQLYGSFPQEIANLLLRTH